MGVSDLMDLSQPFTIGPVRVDPERRLVSSGRDEVSLEPKVMAVLMALVEQRGQVVTREALLDKIWAREFGGDESLTRAVSLLRKALEDRKAIETVTKKGYRFTRDILTEGQPRNLNEGNPGGTVATDRWRLIGFGGVIRELQRRRTFRTAGVYIIGSWLVMQAADVFFPAWGLPDSAINILLTTAVFGFPVVMVFGWFFDVTERGIVRTPPADAKSPREPLPLHTKDYALLVVLAGVVGVIAYGGIQDLRDRPAPAPQPSVEQSTLPKLENAIAVLPFANSTADPSNEAFCDGISEEILHKLARVNGLKVIGRNSSFAFKGSSYPTSRIASLLGASYLVQGSVRRDGQQLRIVASLVDQNGEQRWSQAFDRELDGIFAIQSEIAETVTATVAPTIAFTERPSHEPDSYAYENFLIGRELVRKRDATGAAERLERAIELDPRFAEAYAELAIALALGTRPKGRDLPGARGAINTALALDPGLPRALAAQGLVLIEDDPPDYNRARELLESALISEPSMVDAMNWLGAALTAQGQFAEALVLLEKALRIDPLHRVLGLNLATRYAQSGQYDRANEIYRRQLGLPELSREMMVSARDYYRATGQISQLIALGKLNAEQQLHHHFDLAAGYSLLGLWERAEYWSNRIVHDWADHPSVGMGWYSSLVIYYQGDLERSLEQLEEANRRAPEKVRYAWRMNSQILGLRQALVGRFDEAIATLEPGVRHLQQSDRFDSDGFLALAWSYQNVGRVEAADSLIRQMTAHYERAEQAGFLHESGPIYRYALLALLEGVTEQALDRLERAIQAGWRDLVYIRHDPRWDGLRQNPRFQAALAVAEADLDRQREEVLMIESRRDFIAEYEAIHGPPM